MVIFLQNKDTEWRFSCPSVSILLQVPEDQAKLGNPMTRAALNSLG
jgi:hypothetical protein